MLHNQPPSDFKALLIQDNREEARLIRLLLRESTQRNYCVTWKKKLGTALASLESSHFDLILFDIGLPDSQGLENTRIISERAPQSALVILAAGENKYLWSPAGHPKVENCLLKGNLNSIQLDRIIGLAFERKYRQHLLQLENSSLQTVIDGMIDPIIVVTPDRKIVMCNLAARKTFRLEEQPRLQHCHDLLEKTGHSCQTEQGHCPLEQTLKYGHSTRAVQTIRDDRETSRHFEVTISPLKCSATGIESLIKTWRDITQLYQHEQQLKASQSRLTHLAHHDPLTGLPNRLFLFDRLQNAIEKARRQRFQIAVLFADLDRFKEINDTLGHGVGDLVLKETAQRFQATLRKSDTVARMGGDEFVMIIEKPPTLPDVIKVVRKLVHAINRPQAINGHALTLTTSIGISIYPSDGDDGEQLIAKADQAMLRAKARGKNNFQFFEPAMEVTAEKLEDMEAALRQALQANQFQLVYQPRLSLLDNRITGIEALLRWRHPSRGLLSPETFLPLIEDGNLIIDMGDWVLRRALRDRNNWRSAQLRNIPLAINISPQQIRHPDFVPRIEQALQQSDHPPQSLELEFQENDQLYESTSVRQLGQLGIALAVDNFGIAPTFLPGLVQLPCTRLTLDRSLSQWDETTDKLALLRAAIAIGHSLNIPVVAKGIETASQLRVLLEQGCPQGQGFLFSRPLAGDRLDRTETLPFPATA
ncbi:MAG: EAL domain-containing protein [Desulfuromonadaceae bacterium]